MKKNTVHVEYRKNGKTYFCIVNRYSAVPRGVEIVSVKIVNS